MTSTSATPNSGPGHLQQAPLALLWAAAATLLVSVVLLVPWSLWPSALGYLLAPLAVVVLGGLFTSTFLNLIVVPAGWWYLEWQTQDPRAY